MTAHTTVGYVRPIRATLLACFMIGRLGKFNTYAIVATLVSQSWNHRGCDIDLLRSRDAIMESTSSPCLRPIDTWKNSSVVILFTKCLYASSMHIGTRYISGSHPGFR